VPNFTTVVDDTDFGLVFVNLEELDNLYLQIEVEARFAIFTFTDCWHLTELRNVLITEYWIFSEDA
jgi:hypothetical protein